ncbi:MAG: hypothetical protein R3350_03270, partial [Saprospiraceae bacterium]|nr:hypothetical protein [Saprospiraceae bacterium]
MTTAMEGGTTRQVQALSSSEIVADAHAHVLDLFNRRQDSRLVFHNYQLALETNNRVYELAREEKVSAESVEVAQLAAWFLYTGYLFEYEDHLTHSLRQLEGFLSEADYAGHRKLLVMRCLQTIGRGDPPSDQAERLLSDAHQVSSYLSEYREKNPLLRLEREFMNGQRMERAEWASLQLQELLSVQLYFPFTRTAYGSELAQHILYQKKRLEKAQRNNGFPGAIREADLKPFQEVETEGSRRGIQTFFRSNYRNHINLSSIADNKANIMISVNSILISVLITILTYRNITSTNPSVLL